MDMSELLQLKTVLIHERGRIRDQHRDGASPAEVAGALTDLADRTVARVHQLAVDASPAADRLAIVRDLAMVAVGGYGRRDLAPHSDIDLLFLVNNEAAALREFVSRMVRDLWDAGLKLSHSMRTVADCISAARQDLTVRTALCEARLLSGSSGEFADLQRGLAKLLSTVPINRLINEIETQRAQEHHDYHARTVLLCEPNLKKSPGGLRDYHTLRWVALARHGIREPDVLRTGGLLSDADADALTSAVEFLQHIRMEMHFEADSDQDTLIREEQLRLAAWLGYQDEGQLLGVERFMQQYYRQTTAISDVVTRFLEGARRPGMVQSVIDRFSRQRIERDFLLSRRSIAVADDAMPAVLADCERVLHLLDIARGYGVTVEYGTFEAIRSAAAEMLVRPEARCRFLDILANPAGLGWLLRQLDRLGLLSRLLPPFAHAHCLIQFNLYHKYTLDEHSLRAVEALLRRTEDGGPLGRVYREIRRKDLLHLAMLLHDLGKGLGDDHCEVGAEIARQVAADFELNEHDRSVLVFLVRCHLLMAHTAFRRDLEDDATLVQFARAVSTPENLRMLYLMTAADTEAVSPENWTAWKESLLTELYFRTAEELTGESPLADEEDRLRSLRERFTVELNGRFPADWLASQLELMPLSYLQMVDAGKLGRHLEGLQSMADSGVAVVSEFLPQTGFVEFAVLTRDDLAEGLFSKMAGTLAASGIQIVSARIVTRADGTVIDIFTGQDLTFAGEPPAGRRQEVAEQIEAVLTGRESVEALLSRRRLPLGAATDGIVSAAPEVAIDNDSSDRCTIVEVFAQDRLGRLYTIARTLFEAGLSVASAKISTHADQIVDAFYVTTVGGAKLDDPAEQQRLRERLLERLCGGGNGG